MAAVTTRRAGSALLFALASWSCTSPQVYHSPLYPSMEEDLPWCATAAPWLLFPLKDQPDAVAPLKEAVEAGDCSVVDVHGAGVSTDIRWFGDGETCEGLRVFGIGNAGIYHVACAGLGDTGTIDPHVTPFRFEVGSDPCPVGDLDGASVSIDEYIGFLSMPRIDYRFWEAGGLLRETGHSSRLFGYRPVYSVPLYCQDIGPTLSLQLLQPDGSESEVVELEMPCDQVETGCTSAGRRAPAWIALLGLPLALARRARRPWAGATPTACHSVRT